MFGDHESSNEEVEQSTAEEGKHERGIARDLWRDLEFQKGSRETKHDHVNTNCDSVWVKMAKELRYASKNHKNTSCQVDNAKDI